MYLAPLNYDRFFHKVFSDIKISRRFIEDFLNKELESIEQLKSKHTITDDAVFVEFDFRCKIDNNYVIIDMQQWYKMDIVQRFFIYHALNTGLQLEDLPKKWLKFDRNLKRYKSVRDYRKLEPVITLIWMVHDTLNFEDDYIEYSMVPDKVIDFIKDEKLWKNKDIIKLLEEREKALELLKNETKELDFIQKNKLIFMFQKNIVKNKKLERYKRWFEFAEATQDKENKEEDFKNYDDEIFLEMIRRLKKDTLSEEDIIYIDEESQYVEGWLKTESDIYEMGEKEGFEKGFEKGEKKGLEKGEKKGFEKGEKKGFEKGEKKGFEKGEKKGFEKGEKSGFEKIAMNMIERGFDIDKIVEITNLTKEEIQKLR